MQLMRTWIEHVVDPRMLVLFRTLLLLAGAIMITATTSSMSTRFLCRGVLMQ